MFWKSLLLNIVCYSNIYNTLPFSIRGLFKGSKYMNRKNFVVYSTTYDDDNEMTNNIFKSTNDLYDSIKKEPFINMKSYNASFSKKAGYDERYDRIPDKASDNDIIMNLTKFYNDMKLLRELESNISYFTKINLINENEKSKNKNSIYSHDLFAGGLLRDW
jgi:hypothetical protein